MRLVDQFMGYSEKQQKRQRRNKYWHNAWKERPRPELYSPQRIIAPLLISGAQFLVSQFRHRRHPQLQAPSLKKMLIFASIVIIVYAILYAFELSWNFVALSPVNLDEKKKGELETSNVEIRRLKDEAEAEAERRKVKCSITLAVEKNETTSVRVQHPPFGSPVDPEMVFPTINLVVYNQGSLPFSITGYRFQKVFPENEAPVTHFDHRVVEQKASIDVTGKVLEAVSGNPPDAPKLFRSFKVCATLEYETDTGYGETEFKLFDLTVALRNDIKLSDKERVRITLSPTART